MAVKFFGQFLIDKKIITKLDLLRAIELQEKTNLRFGDLIVEMGLMTREQIDLTHRSQRHEDLQFGDMAVKMGFLSPEQIQLVLDKQQKKHLYIGGALVKLAIITKEKLDLYLGEFDQSQQTYTAEEIVIPAEIPHQPVWEIVADMTYKMLTRVAGATFRTAPCRITRTIPERPLVIEIVFSGSINARYLLTISESTRQLLTNVISKGSNTETAEEIGVTVKEFVNIVGENVVGKAAQLGFSIETTPAQIYQQNEINPEIYKDLTGLLFPIYFSNGEELELTILFQKESVCH